jgi:hypothetical protein
METKQARLICGGLVIAGALEQPPSQSTCAGQAIRQLTLLTCFADGFAAFFLSPEKKSA